MKKKNLKGIAICITTSISLTILVIGLSIGMIFAPTCSYVRNKMCEHYQDDSTYDTIYARIDKVDGGLICVTLDDERNITSSYLFISVKVLKDNGFYEDFDSETVYEICVNEAIWWDGGKPFAVALKTEDKVYLDFETGKANLIDYIQNEMY